MRRDFGAKCIVMCAALLICNLLAGCWLSDSASSSSQKEREQYFRRGSVIRHILGSYFPQGLSSEDVDPAVLNHAILQCETYFEDQGAVISRVRVGKYDGSSVIGIRFKDTEGRVFYHLLSGMGQMQTDEDEAFAGREYVWGKGGVKGHKHIQRQGGLKRRDESGKE